MYLFVAGLMGDEGEKGLVGDRGENGTKGDIGITGDMGDKGGYCSQKSPVKTCSF